MVAQALGDFGSSLGIDLRDDHGKLIAALAEDRIAAAHLLAQRTANLGQVAAFEVPLALVDLLEAVEDENELAATALMAGDLRRQANRLGEGEYDLLSS
ncbi:MAG TPA: hypothetical protein VFX44_00975 [Solirubrobacterales bacterium]|nr:hypothetical protein [Solirubrobacterales bacterium]